MGGIEACASRWRWVEGGEGGGEQVDITFLLGKISEGKN